MSEDNEKHTLALLVNNRAGVLMRIVSLFSRRGYNIDSLSVGETEDEKKSRITIVVKANELIVEQIIRQVGKLVDVTNVMDLKPSKSVQSELLLIKVKAPEKQRTSVVELAELFHAKIVDVTSQTITMQVTGSEDKLDSFLKIISNYGIVEMARTGTTALGRGGSKLSDVLLEDTFN